MGMEFQFYKMEKPTEMDSDDGCKTLWMYLTPLNSTLGNLKDGKFCYVYFITIKRLKKYNNPKITYK